MNTELLLLVLFWPVVALLGYKFWREHRANKLGICPSCGVALTHENAVYLQASGVPPSSTRMCRRCKERLGRRQLFRFLLFLAGGTVILIAETVVIGLTTP